MRALTFALLSVPCLLAQSPKFDEAFFNGDRTRILRLVTERARAMNSKDVALLVEYGRGYLAALDKQKGVEMLRLAEAMESQDGMVLRSIGQAYLKAGFKSEALSAYEQWLADETLPLPRALGEAFDAVRAGLD